MDRQWTRSCDIGASWDRSSGSLRTSEPIRRSRHPTARRDPDSAAELSGGPRAARGWRACRACRSRATARRPRSRPRCGSAPCTPEICSRARRAMSSGSSVRPCAGTSTAVTCSPNSGCGQAEHERVEHFVELLLEEELDFARRDVGALRLHHLGGAADEVRAAVVQEHAVAGVEPAVGVEHVLALLLVVPVHEAVAPDPQLALLAVGHGRAPVSGSTTRYPTD